MSAAASLSGGSSHADFSGSSSHADTIRGTRPPSRECKVDAVDEDDFTNIEKVEPIRPQVRTGVDLDDYFVSLP